LVQFLFEDEASIRPLDKVADPDLLDEIAPVVSFVEKALTELSCEELDVVFWEDEGGMLKMTLRGPDHVVAMGSGRRHKRPSRRCVANLDSVVLQKLSDTPLA
jgi:hypothetical protein